MFKSLIAPVSERDIWPPPWMLLAGAPGIPREEWNKDEWRAYALFLEESGKKRAQELMRLRHDLSEALKRLTRRKPQKTSGARRGTILAEAAHGYPVSASTPVRRRGRKPIIEVWAMAQESLMLKATLEKNMTEDKRVTDRDALELCLSLHGIGRYRATTEYQPVIHEMRRIRKRMRNSQNTFR